MRVGFDFDNTVVCYDEVFLRAAVERGLVPAGFGAGKAEVRAYLCRNGREDDWTRLQGLVYGPLMPQASMFQGALECFKALKKSDVPACIISHRSRLPYLGPRYDLHGAAWAWLEAQGFFDPARCGLSRDQVFFECARADKMARIVATGCALFVDDLPEFLLDDQFPASVQRVLFDPVRSCAPDSRLRRVASWSEITDIVLGRDARADCSSSA